MPFNYLKSSSQIYPPKGGLQQAVTSLNNLINNVDIVAEGTLSLRLDGQLIYLSGKAIEEIYNEFVENDYFNIGSTGVKSTNGITGEVNIEGLGGVTVTTEGNTIYVSGHDDHGGVGGSFTCSALESCDKVVFTTGEQTIEGQKIFQNIQRFTTGNTNEGGIIVGPIMETGVYLDQSFERNYVSGVEITESGIWIDGKSVNTDMPFGKSKGGGTNIYLGNSTIYGDACDIQPAVANIDRDQDNLHYKKELNFATLQGTGGISVLKASEPNCGLIYISGGESLYDDIRDSDFGKYIVYTTGDQTISGFKTFADDVTVGEVGDWVMQVENNTVGIDGILDVTGQIYLNGVPITGRINVYKYVNNLIHSGSLYTSLNDQTGSLYLSGSNGITVIKHEATWETGYDYIYEIKGGGVGTTPTKAKGGGFWSKTGNSLYYESGDVAVGGLPVLTEKTIFYANSGGTTVQNSKFTVSEGSTGFFHTRVLVGRDTIPGFVGQTFGKQIPNSQIYSGISITEDEIKIHGTQGTRIGPNTTYIQGFDERRQPWTWQGVALYNDKILISGVPVTTGASYGVFLNDSKPNVFKQNRLSSSNGYSSPNELVFKYLDTTGTAVQIFDKGDYLLFSGSAKESVGRGSVSVTSDESYYYISGKDIQGKGYVSVTSDGSNYYISGRELSGIGGLQVIESGGYYLLSGGAGGAGGGDIGGTGNFVTRSMTGNLGGDTTVNNYDYSQDHFNTYILTGTIGVSSVNDLTGNLSIKGEDLISVYVTGTDTIVVSGTLSTGNFVTKNETGHLLDNSDLGNFLLSTQTGNFVDKGELNNGTGHFAEKSYVHNAISNITLVETLNGLSGQVHITGDAGVDVIVPTGTGHNNTISVKLDVSGAGDVVIIYPPEPLTSIKTRGSGYNLITGNDGSISGTGYHYLNDNPNVVLISGEWVKPSETGYFVDKGMTGHLAAKSDINDQVATAVTGDTVINLLSGTFLTRSETGNFCTAPCGGGGAGGGGAAGVSSLNGETGVLEIQGTGSVVVSTDGKTIIVSGSATAGGTGNLVDKGMTGNLVDKGMTGDFLTAANLPTGNFITKSETGCLDLKLCNTGNYATLADVTSSQPGIVIEDGNSDPDYCLTLGNSVTGIKFGIGLTPTFHHGDPNFIRLDGATGVEFNAYDDNVLVGKYSNINFKGAGVVASQNPIVSDILDVTIAAGGGGGGGAGVSELNGMTGVIDIVSSGTAADDIYRLKISTDSSTYPKSIIIAGLPTGEWFSATGAVGTDFLPRAETGRFLDEPKFNNLFDFYPRNNPSGFVTYDRFRGEGGIGVSFSPSTPAYYGDITYTVTISGSELLTGIDKARQRFNTLVGNDPAKIGSDGWAYKQSIPENIVFTTGKQSILGQKEFAKYARPTVNDTPGVGTGIPLVISGENYWTITGYDVATTHMVDWDSADTHTIKITNHTDIDFKNHLKYPGRQINIILKNEGVIGGASHSYIVNFPHYVQWPFGDQPNFGEQGDGRFAIYSFFSLNPLPEMNVGTDFTGVLGAVSMQHYSRNY
tara:strand:- start:9689 stop:14293 length:4605 start_codon:yes stop_codon:yes gene_type:complete